MENVCKTLKHVDLYLRHDLQHIEERPLPEGFSFRFYQPGDEIHWARMWKSAGGFKSEEAALETFRRDFPDEDALKTRMIFLTDAGIPFATVAVWFGDTPDQGRLHWVCIDEEHQNYTANITYGNGYYNIAGMMEKEEFLKILKGIYFK